MKNLILLLSLMTYQNSFATWTEKVNCRIERTSVDDLSFSSDAFSGVLKMSSIADVAIGNILVQSEMIPAYQVQLTKEADGRYDRLILETKLGQKMIARSTVIALESSNVNNSFISADKNYEINIICKTK